MIRQNWNLKTYSRTFSSSSEVTDTERLVEHRWRSIFLFLTYSTNAQKVKTQRLTLINSYSCMLHDNAKPRVLILIARKLHELKKKILHHSPKLYHIDSKRLIYILSHVKKASIEFEYSPEFMIEFYNFKVIRIIRSILDYGCIIYVLTRDTILKNCT